MILAIFKRAFLYLFTIALMGVSAAGWAVSVPPSVQVTDAVGNRVHLSAPARRVVGLAPNITELLYAAGVGPFVVGVADHSDYPLVARALPAVGGAGRIDFEQMLALHPDLVVVWGSATPTTQLGRLRRLGFAVYVSEPHTIADIAEELKRFGQLAHTESTANTAADRFLRELSDLRTRYSQRPSVSVFYEVWDHPLMSVGAEHLLSRVIELCGGRNILTEHGNLAPTISLETVLAANPEAIVASEVPGWLNDWRAWPRLTAVDRGNLFEVSGDLLQRHTPRLLEGARLLCEALETARQRLHRATVQ